MGQGRLMAAERRFLTCDPGKPARLGGASRRAGLGCGVGRKGKKGEGQQQPQADHEVLTRRACRQRPASAAAVNLRRARIAPERHSRRTRATRPRSEEHTSELQSLMRNSYAVFCLTKKKTTRRQNNNEVETSKSE